MHNWLKERGVEFRIRARKWFSLDVTALSAASKSKANKISTRRHISTIYKVQALKGAVFKDRRLGWLIIEFISGLTCSTPH